MATDTEAGPAPTIERLRWMLQVTYGTARRGGPDTARAAAGLGVSRRTVQRWLSPTRPVPVPAARLEQITAASRPTAETVRSEQQALAYAHEAIAGLALPRGAGVLPAWRDQGWLEPHLVVVLELGKHKLRQVAFSRVAGRPTADLRRRGEVVDFTTVPSRFHAIALSHLVLEHVDAWRIQAPAGVTGRTQTWSADAPELDIAALARAAGLRDE